jgi:hypothetical protein
LTSGSNDHLNAEQFVEHVRRLRAEHLLKERSGPGTWVTE